LLQRSFPFDPKLKHHLVIAIALAIWVFVFLFLTEPLDVNELSTFEKLQYLPLYGLVGALSYLLMLPFQGFLYRRNEKQWMLKSEIFFFLFFVGAGLVLSRCIYLYIIVYGEPNPYTLWYFATALYLPAMSTIFPIVLVGRWAFGKYLEKQLEDQKIEIEGEGTYEGLRLQWNDLVYVKADDNYVEVSFLNNGALKKQLIRSKLSKVEGTFPELLRTHRSYLINPFHFLQFKTIEGKRNLQLTSEIIVPISKTYSEKVTGQLNN